MKLVRFEFQGQEKIGVYAADGVIDIAAHAPGLVNWADALAPEGRAALAKLAAPGSGVRATHALDQVRLLCPVVPRNRIFCIGINYRSHADETGRELPVRPSAFTRTHESIVPHGETVLRPTVSHQFDYEGELAVIIGTRGRNITEAAALDHIAGYSCFMDGSVRDYQKFSVTAGKNFDNSGSFGPWVVTSDEIPDPTRLTLRTRLNGNTVQESGTDRLIYSVPLIVSFLSEVTELTPGDVIATGTPAGVGHRRNPQLWMKKGDLIEVEIYGIGVLANTVGDAA